MTEEITLLNGKEITAILGLFKGSREIIIKCSTEYYLMYHEQDCCEDVYLEDYSGIVSPDTTEPWQDTEVISFTKESNYDKNDGELQWTFYRLNTKRGTLVLRWYGYSYYYSTDVGFRKLKNDEVNAALASMRQNYQFNKEI